VHFVPDEAYKLQGPITDCPSEAAEHDTPNSNTVSPRFMEAVSADVLDINARKQDHTCVSIEKFAENVGHDVFTEMYFALSMTVLTGLVFLAGALSPWYFYRLSIIPVGGLHF
jgi:hypothetical protein